MGETLEYQIERLSAVPIGGLYRVDILLTETNVEDPLQFQSFFYVYDPSQVVEILNAKNNSERLTLRVERGAEVKNWICADGKPIGDYISGPMRSKRDGRPIESGGLTE